MFGLAAWRERAAARWLARMGNEGEAFDRAAFERWRARSANARAFDEVAASWRRPLPIAATRFAQGRRATEQERVPSRWRTPVLVAACAALLFAVVGAFMAVRSTGIGSNLTQVAISAPAPRMVRLGDGSTVLLGDGATMALAFSDKFRRLVLRGGHARFDVAHDPARPFQVQAGAGLITARGTLFDVRLMNGTARIALLRGAIDVTRLAEARPVGAVRRLAAGQSVTVPATGRIGPIESATFNEPVGAAAMLSFDRTPLADAIAAFNRRNGRQIRLVTSAATAIDANGTVSGAFNATDPDGFAQMLGTMFDLALDRRPNGDLVLTPKRQ